MATTKGGTTNSMARVSSVHSSLGTHAPLNTPTRRFYGSTVRSEILETGVPNPNVYVVQPFKNASVPKDFVYSKKNAPNPAEHLLNSTINLINHFTTCYEAVKQQLQEEKTKERESALFSRSMTMNGTLQTNSRNTTHKPIKQAKLRPLVLHENQNKQRRISIDNCIGILPVPIPKAGELTEIYQEKLRLLKKFKPQYFDSQGNLLSNNRARTLSQSQSSIPSSKKSATASFRTPHNTLLTVDNLPFDERRTFLTEFTHDENDEINENQQNLIEETNAVNQLINNNTNDTILKVLEIKQISSKR